MSRKVPFTLFMLLILLSGLMVPGVAAQGTPPPEETVAESALDLGTAASPDSGLEGVAWRYTFSSSVLTYTPLITGTVHGTASNDDTSFPAINLGFTFTYDGVDYTQVSIQSNGWIALGATIASSYYPLSTGTTNNAIAALARDLQGNGTTSELRSLTEGTAPNRVFTVQWTDYKRYGSSYVGDAFDFQIKLYETSNEIEVVYGDFTVFYVAAPPYGPQVGLRGPSNADFNNRTLDASLNWSASVAGTTNAASMTLTDLVFPTTGLTYKWVLAVGVFLDPPAQTGGDCRGSDVVYNITVVNQTGVAQSFSLSYTNVWPVSGLPSATGVIPDWGTEVLTATVHVPWAAPAGASDVLTVVASGGGYTGQATVTTISSLANGWDDYADVPLGREVRAPSVVYWDGKLYKIGGYGYIGSTGAARTWVDIYDIATNSWTAGADLPAARYWIDCEAIAAKIYCGGGYLSAGVNTLYIYDIATNTWTTGATLPANRYNAASVQLGGKYYLIGGYTTTYQATMIIYDPATNTWDSTKAPMNVARRYFHAGVIGGKIYVAGGYGSSPVTYLSSAEVYDPATNTWTYVASMPMNWVNAADGVKHDRFLVLAGGSPTSTAGASNGALVYDAVTDTWAWLPLLDRMLYSAEGDIDGNGDFWYVSGRMSVGGVWSNSPYTTKLAQCEECEPVYGADFTVAPTVPRPAMPATFTGSVAGGSPVITYDWSFGDSTYGSGQVVTHTYAVAGTYTVVMTATNCDGASYAVATKSVVVAPGPLIVVDPLALESTQCPDTVTTQTLSICNQGDAALVWNISEVSWTGVLAGSMPFVPAVVTGGPAQNPGLTTASPDRTAPAAPEAPVDPEAVLWDQPASDAVTAYVDQEFPDAPTFSSFLADDFINGAPWAIDTIFVPGNGWNGFATLFNATGLTWQIYADCAGVPCGDPSGAGSPPVWTTTLPPTDPQVLITTGGGGYPSNTTLNLAAPLYLPAGHWWLVFYPSMPFSGGGQYGRHPAGTANGYIGQFVNPGGGFGYGTVWQSWAVIGATAYDIAFRLEGSLAYDIPWLSEDPTSGSVVAGDCATVTVTFDSAGLTPNTYTGALEITSNDNLNPLVTVAVTLNVAGPPTGVSFAYAPAVPWVGEPVAFDGSATADVPIDYSWDFGDGVYGSGEDPVHTYTTYGTFTVVMTATACNYAVVVTDTVVVASCYVFVDEDFESPFPPLDWTVVNNGGTCTWTRNDAFATPRPNYAGGVGFCADADSDKCGSGSTMDTELRTMVLDLSVVHTATLSYVAAYNDLGAGGDLADTDVSTDGGATWTTLQRWDEDHSPNGPGELVTLNLTPYAFQDNVMVRFHYYTATYDWWWEVDQVQVGGCYVPGAAPDIAVTPISLTQTLYRNQAADQLLNIANVGLLPLNYTLDEGCGAPVDWLALNPLGGAVPAQGDEDVTVSFDSTGMAVGTYNTSICVNSDDPDEPQVVVPVTLVVLETPEIAVNPEALAAEQCADTVTTQTLQICNVGEATLEWSLREMPRSLQQGGFAPFVPAPAVERPVITSPDQCAAYENYTGVEPLGADKFCHPDIIPVPMGGLNPDGPTDIGYTLEMYSTDTLRWFALNDFPGQTTIGPTPTYYGMDFDVPATTLYALNDATDQLGTIDLATGAFTALVSCPPPVDNWTGLTIDPVNGTFYGSDATALYTIDPATGASTLVGAFGTTLMIDIAMNTAGEMYGHDIGTDSIYSINPTTGVATLIGPTGYAANYAQGMDFDNDDGTLYIFVYTGGGTNVFGTVNLSTGAVTPLAQNNPTGEFEGAIQTPGLTDIPWLSEDLITGTVPAGECQDVVVTFDSTGLTPGDYLADLVIDSNDPVNPQVAVPVTLTVGAPAEALALEWSPLTPVINEVVYFTGTAAGMPPIVLDWDFGDGSYGSGEYTTHVYAVPGDYTVVMTVSNDCGYDVMTATITVVGEPDIVVTPLVLESTQCPDTTTTQDLVICNEGDVPLHWALAELLPPLASVPGAPRVPYAGRPVALSLAGDSVSVETNPPTVDAPVSLILDDGTVENNIGIGGTLEFIFLNRFTPLADEFPFDLNQVQIYFDSTGLVNVGDDIVIVVYENTTGGYDPAPGSNWLLSYPTTVQALDTWNIYDLPAPVALNGPGDVLIGALALEVPGTSYWPAAIDQTATQQRSWAGWWSASPPPDPPLLPPDTSWVLIDDYFPGNWMIRGYGETSAAADLPWLSEDPISGTVAAGACQTITVTFDSTGLTAGVYTGALEITSDDPDTPVVTVPVTLTVDEPLSDADFTWSPTMPVVDEVVYFTATAAGEEPIAYTWDLGDGNVATGEYVTHTYDAAGTYTVILTATNSCGDLVVTHDVTVVAACVEPAGADFAWTPESPTVDEVTYFTGTVATGTAPLAYAWDLGDGTMASGQYVTHAYAAAGTYTVLLTVTNDCGEATATYDVVVVEACEAPSGVDFTWLPLAPFVGDTVTFTGTVAGGTEPITLAWAFGDGGTGTGSPVDYTYTVAGTYTVVLTATNACGEASATYDVVVSEPEPVVYYVYLPLIIRP